MPIQMGLINSACGGRGGIESLFGFVIDGVKDTAKGSAVHGLVNLLIITCIVGRDDGGSRKRR